MQGKELAKICEFLSQALKRGLGVYFKDCRTDDALRNLMQ